MEENKRYTPDGLPVVSEDVVETFKRDMMQRFNEGDTSFMKYGNSFCERIWEQNENLAKFIDFYEEKTEREEFENFLIGALYMYELLRAQGEVNCLEE